MHIEPDTLPSGHVGIAARLKKGPTIHSSAWVVPGATVIGDVTLEEESSVWYGAVLRGDINRIVIGPRSNVQDNAVIHLDTDYPTMMGELVTVGHSAIVHACTIGDEVLVGMGTIVLDDVEVGARSIIGANALITGGMKIPPGSLVLGSPAKMRLYPPATIEWRQGPAALPPGAKMAALEGDPTKEGPFVVRFQFPAGYRVPPHTHPKTERVTVISGTLYLAAGETLDRTSAK